MLCDFRRTILPVPVILNRLAAVLLVLIFGILLGSSVRFGHEHHDHELSVQRRNSFDHGHLARLCRKEVQLLPAQLGVRDLSRLEYTAYFDLVTLAQEANRVLDQKGKVVFCDPRTDLYTLNLLTLAFLIAVLLLGQVFELAVVDDLADRRLGGRRYHYKVKSPFPCQVEGLPTLKYPKLVAVVANDPYVSNAQNAFVNKGARIWPGVSSKACYVVSPRSSLE